MTSHDNIRLYSDLVTDSLTEFSYDADLAGITYSFLTHASGLYVSMNGYNDKVIVLVQHVLERVKQITVRPERLIVMKEEVGLTIHRLRITDMDPCRSRRRGRTSSLDSRISCQNITADIC